MGWLFELRKTRPIAHAVGLLAGRMTDPPALAFASNIAGSDAPTVAYATVYQLTTLVRILSAQAIALALFR